MEVSGQHHALAGKSPWYPVYRRLVGFKTGLDAMVKKKILSLSGFQLWPSSLLRVLTELSQLYVVFIVPFNFSFSRINAFSFPKTK
jgi:hypothetical protein